ncbi:MAG: tetratricopeptide repeat protein [Microcoleaceae cyanobacterium]
MHNQSKDTSTKEILLREGNNLKQQGKLDEAIEKYSCALQMNPDFVPALNQLSYLFESQQEFDQAIPLLQHIIQIQPQQSLIKVRLANAMIHQGNIDEAISLYQQAITQEEQLPAWVYARFGTALEKNDQIDEAITAYEQAAKLQPENSYIHQKLIALLRMQGREDEAAIWVKQLPQVKQGEIYSQIWQALNQTSLQRLEEESVNYPTEFDPKEVEQYFILTSQYKIIDITSLSDEDKSYLETAGLSLNYLKQNQNLVTATGVSQEETQEEEHLLTQQLAAQEGCFYAICPITGQVLQSNRSVLFDRLVFYYRFVGNEVFYLMIAGNCFQKEAIYFPRLELFVHLLPNEHPSYVRGLTSGPGNLGMTPLKSASVNHWNIIKQYLSNVELVEKCAVVGINFSTFHHLVNELSGIQRIYESGCLQQIDKFLVVGPEYYGGIDEIFPEIPSEKVERLNCWQTTKSTSWITRNIIFPETSKKILKNNFFAFKLGDEKVSDELQNRLYQASLRKCSSDFLTTIETAKKVYFPLFWISFRTHFRTWLSQVEGIANIVNGLSDQFPNIAVVFDGYTRIDINGNLLINDKDEEIIQNEKDVVSQIQSLFTKQIKVYDIIGSPMYEVVVWANAIDLYFVPGGSTAAKTTQVVSKPGFMHSNRTVRGMNNLSENETVDFPQEGEGVAMNYSYDFDWKIAYEKLLKIASSIKKNE